MTIAQRAADARALIDDACFKAIIEEIQKDAVAAFLRPAATPAELEAAHQKVRAIETIQNALQSRLDAEAFQLSKDQHRGND